jgi:pimeloyl-ACP methyl ester carboxylesterase
MPGGNKKLQELNDPLVIGAMGTGALLAALAAAIGGWIGYSALRINHRAPLPPATNAERRTFISPAAGMVSYYVDRKPAGRPLVLIHSINAAASAYEMMPIFEHYRGKRPVYALDLPGFGFSDRSDRAYSPWLYADAIVDFLRTQVREGSADVVALSLGSEFAARAAKGHPELFNSLTLISPSGFTDRTAKKASQRASQQGKSDSLYRLFSFPLWSQAFYDLLVTPPSINYFLKQSFEGTVDPGLKHYAYATSHQPGARFAPLYFVSGKLFSPDIRQSVYEQLVLPVLVLFDKDSFVRFDTLPQMAQEHPNWHTVRIAPTKGLPHFEKMADVAQALDSFWQNTGTRQQASQEVRDLNA